MDKRATSKPASSPPPADETDFQLMPRVDAVYLHTLAKGTRRTIADAVLPDLLHDMHGFAQRGAMDMLLVPDKPDGDIKTRDFLESLQPDLSRLGFDAEVILHVIPRLGGMKEEKPALAISWRTPRTL
ncbi:MAG: hypothetical protein IPK22_11045 [Verrucomicrobiaceae bacterium]|nr:hypothetical protein [Verrucomicrobiaceae bacterium]